MGMRIPHLLPKFSKPIFFNVTSFSFTSLYIHSEVDHVSLFTCLYRSNSAELGPIPSHSSYVHGRSFVAKSEFVITIGSE